MNSSSEMDSDQDECFSCTGVECSCKDASLEQEQGFDALEQSIIDCLEDEDMSIPTVMNNTKIMKRETFLFNILQSQKNQEPDSPALLNMLKIAFTLGQKRGHADRDSQNSNSNDSGFFQASTMKMLEVCCSAGKRAYRFLKKNPGIVNIEKLRLLLGEKYRIFEQKLPSLTQNHEFSISSQIGQSQYAWRTANESGTLEEDRLMARLIYIYITTVSESAELSFITESEAPQIKLAKVHVRVCGKASFKIFFFRLEIAETLTLYDAILTIYYFTRVFKQPYRYPVLQLFTAFDTLLDN